MTDLVFPKPPKRNRKQETLSRKRELAAFRHQVLAADGHKCVAIKIGCKCKGRLVAHHIDFRSHCGGNDIKNGATLCELAAHYHVHNGIKIGGVLYSGREYMLMILRSHKDDKGFRWQAVMEILERRYGDGD